MKKTTDDWEIEKVYTMKSGWSMKLPSGRILTLSGQGLWVSERKRLLCRVLIEPEDLPGLRELLSKEVRENGNRDSDEEG